jgi:hypothetical protein
MKFERSVLLFVGGHNLRNIRPSFKFPAIAFTIDSLEFNVLITLPGLNLKVV